MGINIINKRYTSDGISFEMNYNGYDIELPVKDLSDYDIYDDEKALILEMNLLWQNNNLITVSAGYFIDFKWLKNNIVLRELLQVPDFLENLECYLIHKSFLGNNNFNIEVSLRKMNKQINIIRREGGHVLTNMGSFLLPKIFVDIFDLVDEMNSTAFVSKDKQFEIMARIKKVANGGPNIHLDSYMDNEEAYFPQEINVDVKKISDSELHLEPKFDDIPEEINRTIKKLQGKIESFSQGVGTKRRRVFLNPKVKSNLNKIRESSTISGSDVPRFINNPEAFLDEELGIDMGEFSKRVKGLNILTYQSQPFIDVTPSKDRNWFNFHPGVRLVDENNPEKATDVLDMDEFDQLVYEARKNGEDYIYYKDKWIKVDPASGENFLQANKQLKGMETPNGVHRSKLNGILEIYQNIHRLEYNEDFFALREKIEKEGTYQIPKNLNVTLYKHQIIGYNWLRNLAELNLGGLLADDMGLGKTMQLISLIAHYRIENTLRPSLIILPSILIQNWWEELRRFIDDPPKTYIHHGFNRVKDKSWIEKQELVITTYDTLKRDQLILGKIDWQIMICDEAQRIKNPTTIVSNAIKAMKSKYKYSMTGTPVENSLNELWSIIDFIQPGYLDSLTIFRNKYIKQDSFEDMSIYEELRKRIEPIFLRREKADILTDLPDKVEHKIPCKFSEKQRKIYGEIIQEAKLSGNFLPAVQKLIQVCSHPNLINKQYGLDEYSLMEDCPKLKRTIEIIEKIKESGEKVLIFTKYIEMQKIIQKVIVKVLGGTPHIINGQVTGNRQELIHWFNSTSGFNAMILSPRAAGVGLNITSANHVIHYTREWNPAIENQATDRAYRIGQTKDVQVYYPIVYDNFFETAEQKIHELLEDKAQLYKNVMIPTGKLEISKEELAKILQVR